MRADEQAYPVGSGDVRDPAGLTIREYFIAAAMQGLCANPESWTVKVETLAKVAVDQADAALAVMAADQAKVPK